MMFIKLTTHNNENLLINYKLISTIKAGSHNGFFKENYTTISIDTRYIEVHESIEEILLMIKRIEHSSEYNKKFDEFINSGEV